MKYPPVRCGCCGRLHCCNSLWLCYTIGGKDGSIDWFLSRILFTGGRVLAPPVLVVVPLFTPLRAVVHAPPACGGVSLLVFMHAVLWARAANRPRASSGAEPCVGMTPLVVEIGDHMRDRRLGGRL